jgi:hypothetical protein
VTPKHLGMLAALLVTLFGGWLWGASGRADLVGALRTAEVHNDLLEARASLLGARVNLCDADFSEVSRHLEAARVFVRRAGERVRTPEVEAELRRLDLAGVRTEIDEARRLAATLARGAGGAAHDQ